MRYAVALLVAPTLLSSSALAQEQFECGTRLTPEQAELMRQLEAAGFYESPGMDRFAPDIPVTLHVVRRTDGTGGITAAEADTRLAITNTLWAPIGFQFVRAGSVDFINDSGLFETDIVTELAALWGRNAVPDTINIYFVDSLTYPFQPPGSVLCGIGSFSGFPIQGVAVSNHATCNQGSNSLLAHELGHYFDLLHTHETEHGEECPDGSNCATAGDRLCDTPADPLLGGNNVRTDTCAYTGFDERCGLPFQPDPTNIMSYAPFECTCCFSPGQRSRAMATLTNLRPNLIESGQPNVIWVDFNSGSLFPNGDFTEPYRRLADGLDAVASGGRVVIRAGSSTETGVYTRPAVIDSFLGSARLGQ